jgi:hypothetical protein
MFDRIVVRAQRLDDVRNQIDVGFLAEAMLFYGEVTLIVDRSIVKQLLRTVGPEPLVRCLEEGHLRLAVSENFSGILTKDAGTPRERYDTGLMEIHAQPGGGPVGVERSIVAEDFASVIGRIKLAERLARRASELTSVCRVNQRVGEQIKSDFRNPQFLTEASADILRSLVPDYTLPPGFIFALEEDGNRELVLRTNVDFQRAAAYYGRTVPKEHSTLTPAYVLSLIAGARELTDGAAEANAELASNPVSVRVIQRQVADAVRHRTTSERAIDQFLTVTVDNGRAIREAINSGTRTFRDLLPLLGRAREFKTWLKDKPFDASLVRDFVAETTKADWTKRMPATLYRWLIFTGAGVIVDLLGAGGIGTVAGVALSAADTFLVDRIGDGWRPNQFVNGPLAAFLGATGESGRKKP